MEKTKMPIFCKQCEEEIVNGEKCICISKGVMHGTEFEPSGNEEDWTYIHSRCVDEILQRISSRASKNKVLLEEKEMAVDPITNEILKKWEQAGGNLAKAAREVRAELEEESKEDIYECEHCNAEFRKSEILYLKRGGEIGTIAFCPRCKQATKLICVTGVGKKKHSNH